MTDVLDNEVSSDEPRGRRDLLGKAAVAAAVAAVAGVGISKTASAGVGNGVNFTQGAANTGATVTTSLAGGSTLKVINGSTDGPTGGTNPKKGSIFGTNIAQGAGVMGETTGTSGGWAVYGRSAGDFGIGAYGLTTGSQGTGVVGQHVNGAATGVGLTGISNNGPGVIGVGTTFDLQANGNGKLGVTKAGVVNPPAGASVQGTIARDAAGNLWYCSTSGNPGSWRTLGGPGAAGAFHAVVPARVYDSRVALPLPGALAAGANKTVSVADKRDLVSGAVVTAGYIPAGATAIACNITVAGTAGAGFLAVNPGGNVVVSAATVNWSAGGQILNNGVIVTLDGSRQVTVIAGGSAGAATDFIIDVTGYFL